MRSWTVIVATFFAAQTAAWTTISQSYWGAQLDTIKLQMNPNTTTDVEPVQRLGYMWSSPDSTSDGRGIGGGITWAFDPNLCSNIITSFSEQPFMGIKFVECDEIQAAVHRGFAAWSDNSAKLRFIDVTAECDRLGDSSSTCPLAEIYVTWLTTEEIAELSSSGRRRLTTTNSSNPSLGVSERQSASGQTAALARSFPNYAGDFRLTNGVSPAGLMVETTSATISFNPTLCWYLDSRFCSGFHSLKQTWSSLTPDAILWIFRGLLLLIWVIALLRFIYFFHKISKRAIEAKVAEDEEIHVNIKMRLDAALDAIAHQRATGWLLRGCALVAPITFHWCVFMPCWECYDFEAAAMHEIGHVLGLSHPDEFVGMTEPPGRPGAPIGQNVALTGSIAGLNCEAPWESVAALDYTSESRSSIMKALTQHNPRICLAPDDLEALNVLYPDCSPSRITIPVCWYPQRFTGVARFLAWTLVPIFFVMVFVISVNECVRMRQKYRHNQVLDELTMERKSKANLEKNTKQFLKKANFANTENAHERVTTGEHKGRRRGSLFQGRSMTQHIKIMQEEKPADDPLGGAADHSSSNEAAPSQPPQRRGRREETPTQPPSQPQQSPSQIELAPPSQPPQRPSMMVRQPTALQMQQMANAQRAAQQHSAAAQQQAPSFQQQQLQQQQQAAYYAQQQQAAAAAAAAAGGPRPPPPSSLYRGVSNMQQQNRARLPPLPPQYQPR